MTLIKRSAVVNFSSRQMFELVDNIEDYPRFLPWCHESHIIYRDNQVVEAELDIAWSGIHKSFATRNQLSPYKSIDITLVHGPLRHLEGIWHFIALGEKECRIDLELEFEIGGRLVDKVFQPVFNHIANSLVDLFCKRAVDVYGNNEAN